jgi:predicted RNA-binding Zn ribbon-like protein
MSEVINNNYPNRLIDLALDLINSYDPYIKQPEGLLTPADLDNFYLNHGIPAARPSTQAEVEVARKLRETLHDAAIGAEEAQITGLINRLLSEPPVHVHLALSGENGWQLTYQPGPTMAALERLQFEASLGLALTLLTYGKERLKACVASPCQEVFIDTSKNQSRRFCSEQCANRFNIAAYRERKAGHA